MAELLNSIKRYDSVKYGIFGVFGLKIAISADFDTFTYSFLNDGDSYQHETKCKLNISYFLFPAIMGDYPEIPHPKTIYVGS